MEPITISIRWISGTLNRDDDYYRATTTVRDLAYMSERDTRAEALGAIIFDLMYNGNIPIPPIIIDSQ